MSHRWYGHTRERCSYCKQPGSWLCDLRGDDGQPCRRPMCFWHRQTDGGEDRCREHAPVELTGTVVRAAAADVTFRDGS